jgi:hypothetical protein
MTPKAEFGYVYRRGLYLYGKRVERKEEENEDKRMRTRILYSRGEVGC